MTNRINQFTFYILSCKHNRISQILYDSQGPLKVDDLVNRDVKLTFKST